MRNGGKHGRHADFIDHFRSALLGNGRTDGTVSTTLEFPQIVNFGLKLKPTKRLSLLGELHWAEWSAVKENDLKFDQKIQFSPDGQIHGL